VREKVTAGDLLFIRLDNSFSRSFAKPEYFFFGDSYDIRD